MTSQVCRLSLYSVREVFPLWMLIHVACHHKEDEVQGMESWYPLPWRQQLTLAVLLLSCQGQDELSSPPSAEGPP